MLGYFGVSIVYQTLDLDYMIFSMWSLHMCIHTADLCFIQSLIQRTFVESTQNLTLEKSWVTFCLLVMSQAPQHLRSYMMQVTCDGCLAPQPICSAIYIDSRMSKPIQSHKEKWGGVGRKGRGGGWEKQKRAFYWLHHTLQLILYLFNWLQVDRQAIDQQIFDKKQYEEYERRRHEAFGKILFFPFFVCSV